jgi:hypothetical protein
VGRIDVGVAVEEARYERDAATGVRGELAAVSVGGAAVAVLCHCACGRGCAARFKAAHATKHTIAAKASGYLFNLRRDAETGKWFAEIRLRGVQVKTRLHKHAWQAAAELEWQLARWCAHTGTPRSHCVSNAARLVELGRADAAGVLTEAVTVAPWDLSRWDGGGGKAAPAGERLCACGALCAPVAWHGPVHVTPHSRPPTAQRTHRLLPRPTPAATARRRRRRATATATASPRRRRRRALAAAVAAHPAPPQRLPALRRHRQQPGQPPRERAPAAARPYHHHLPHPQQHQRPPRHVAAA